MLVQEPFRFPEADLLPHLMHTYAWHETETSMRSSLLTPDAYRVGQGKRQLMKGSESRSTYLVGVHPHVLEASLNSQKLHLRSNIQPFPGPRCSLLKIDLPLEAFRILG